MIFRQPSAKRRGSCAPAAGWSISDLIPPTSPPSSTGAPRWTTGEVRIGAGYGDERRQHDPTGRFPLRSHVGVRYLTLTTFLNAFLAQPTLHLAAVEELDTRMRPWQPAAGDGRIIPWNLAVMAQAR
jgi:hypothetical protein